MLIHNLEKFYQRRIRMNNPGFRKISYKYLNRYNSQSSIKGNIIYKILLIMFNYIDLTNIHIYSECIFIYHLSIFLK